MKFRSSFLFNLRNLLILVLVLFGSNGSIWAQETDYSKLQLLEFSAQFEPSTIRKSEHFRLIVNIKFKPGWHIYSVIASTDPDAPPPTRLTIKNSNLSAEGPVYETRPIQSFIKELGFTLSYHEKQATLYQNFVPVEEHAAGRFNSTIKIAYQPCTDVICLPERIKELQVSYEIVSGQPRDEFKVANRGIGSLPIAPGYSFISTVFSGGFWAFIALAALMGLVSLFTPCVFPMIPITITYFSKQAEGKQSKVIKLSLLFAVGIIGTYTGIGLIVSAVFGAGAVLQLAANPFINIAIATVFIIFALTLMGLFEISVPVGIQNYFDQKSRSFGGATGVIVMGFTFTLTAFTCTVQFVGAMLIAAAHGEWIWPLIGMLVFSTVFAFPFFLLAIAPSMVKKIQGKSGDWMGRSKVVLGILELMASVKFLSNADLVWQLNLLSRNAAVAIWTGLLIFITIYLVWTGIRPRLKKTLVQWGFVIMFGGLALYTMRGLNDQSLGSLIDALLPPPVNAHVASDIFVSETESNKLRWLDSLEEAEKEATRLNKPILLEFTGYTCVNCRWMEQNILPRKEIHKALANNFVLVRLFTDGGANGAKNLQLQLDRFRTIALPFYVILSPDGNIQKYYSGISLESTEFLDFLTI